MYLKLSYQSVLNVLTTYSISLIAKFFPFKSNKKFQYIHTSHWFEHVHNLEETIIKIKKLLVKNGLLFIEVPNCLSDYYKLNVGDTPHIQFFTIKSLNILFKKHGFRSLAIDSFGITHEDHLRRLENPKKYEEKINQLKGLPQPGGIYIRALFKFSSGT